MDNNYETTINDLPLEITELICDMIPADGHKKNWNNLPYVNRSYRGYFGTAEYAQRRLAKEFAPSKNIITTEHFYWFRASANIPELGNFSIYRVAAQILNTSPEQKNLVFFILYAQDIPADHPQGQKYYQPAWAVTMNAEYCKIDKLPTFGSHHIWKADRSDPMSATFVVHDTTKSFRVYRLRSPIETVLDADYIEFRAPGDEYFTNAIFELSVVPGVNMSSMPENKTKFVIPTTNIIIHMNLCDEVLTLLKDNLPENAFKFFLNAVNFAKHNDVK